MSQYDAHPISHRSSTRQYINNERHAMRQFGPVGDSGIPAIRLLQRHRQLHLRRGLPQGSCSVQFRLPGHGAAVAACAGDA